MCIRDSVKKVRGKGKVSYDSSKKLDDINKFGKINEVLTKGDEILIQVVKEPISTKGPRVTTELSLAGRYLILVSFSDTINVSKKITQREERMSLINLIKSIRPKNFGVIVRTVAEKKSVSELDKDLQSLTKTWKECIKKIKKAKVGEKIIGEEKIDATLIDNFRNGYLDLIAELNNSSSVFTDKELLNLQKLILFQPKINLKLFLQMMHLLNLMGQ